MPTNTSYYSLGNNRIVYKAQNFATGVTVTAILWNPDLTSSESFTLTELSNGLYWFHYKFVRGGIYPVIFSEGGTEVQFHTIRVKRGNDI